MTPVWQEDLFLSDASWVVHKHPSKPWAVLLVDFASACNFVRIHHSRAPRVQNGPWMYSFGAFLEDEMCGSALWHNCSARGLPDEWRELRRMAMSDEAPRNMASFFLGAMCRWFRENTDVPMLISYQDVHVHAGTIYKATNWIPAHVTRPRMRDREPNRVGTERKYRKDANGAGVASAAKIRWQMPLGGQAVASVTPKEILAASQAKATR